MRWCREFFSGYWFRHGPWSREGKRFGRTLRVPTAYLSTYTLPYVQDFIGGLADFTSSSCCMLRLDTQASAAALRIPLVR